MFANIRSVIFTIPLSIGMGSDIGNGSERSERSESKLVHTLAHLPGVRELRVIIDTSEHHSLITPRMTSNDFEGLVGSVLHEMSEITGISRKELSFVFQNTECNSRRVCPWAALSEIVDTVRELLPTTTIKYLTSGRKHPRTEIIIQYAAVQNPYAFSSALLSIRTFPYREWLDCIIRVS